MAVSRKKGDIHFNLACQGLFKNSSPRAGVWGGGGVLGGGVVEGVTYKMGPYYSECREITDIWLLATYGC